MLLNPAVSSSLFVHGLMMTGAIIVNATRVWVRVCVLILVLHFNSSQVSLRFLQVFLPVSAASSSFVLKLLPFLKHLSLKNMLLPEAS